MANRASPDPLFEYRWKPDVVSANRLQQYKRKPQALLGAPAAIFQNAESLLIHGTGLPMVVHPGTGSIAFDFGAECAGWLQLRSPDLGQLLEAQAVSVLMSSSEFTEPQFTTPTNANNKGNCTAPVTAIGNNTFELQLNAELYEGLRYGWLHVKARQQFQVTSIEAVCQVMPINYVDHAFEAQGPVPAPNDPPGAGSYALEQVFYTALYTTRVDILPGGFGSILMDRGDRISWTGDAHLAQKAALIGFEGDHILQVIHDNTERTKGVDNGIITCEFLHESPFLGTSRM